MSNPYFKFKQFTVYQDKCGMKVGIDGVLLGAWAAVNDSVKNILDIGTGTGLIALMMAQRCNAFIDAIDIDKDAVAQAKSNIQASPWSNRINTRHLSLQDFVRESSKKYDLIVSNPPYFVNSLKSPSMQRTNARHTNELSHQDLLFLSKKLLTREGSLSLILPTEEADKCIEHAEKIALYLNHEVFVHPKPSKAAKRKLLTFELCEKSRKIENITIETEQRHQYTPEFYCLVKDYYLK